MEKRGYSPYKIDEHTARYQIREKFYGLDAIEIAIPTNTDSVYAVTVYAEVKELWKAIRDRSGAELQIYREDFKAKSGVAYLIAENKERSTFVCFTFEE